MKRKEILVCSIATAFLLLLLNSVSYGMGFGNAAPTISSVTANPNPTSPGFDTELSCFASDSDGEITQYEWTADGGSFPNGTTTEVVAAPTNTILWKAPVETGYCNITVTVYDNGGPYGGPPATATEYLTILVDGENNSPVISSLVPEADSVFVGTSIFVIASATDADGDPLTFQWSASGGTISGDDDIDPEAVTWTAPQTGGNHTITITVTDGRGGQSSQSVGIFVTVAQEAGFISTPSANPVRIASDDFGRIYVSDTHKNRIQIYDQFGGFFDQIEDIDRPLGLAVSSDGKLYVGEDGSDQISVYSISGSALGTLSGPSVQMPNSITIDSDLGRIFVADTKAAVVLVYDVIGTYLYSIDGSLAVSGGFVFPVGVSLDTVAQTLYVSDRGGYKIYGFDYSGNPKVSFGSSGKGDGKFSRLQGITVDNNGRIFAVDTYQSYIQVFDSDGQFLASIGNFGAAKGELSIPLDVHVDTSNRLLVTSNDNSRIEVYSLDESTIPLPNQPPSQPTLYLPAGGSEVQTSNPMLSILPATDEDEDVLTYDFEVYELGEFDTSAAAADIPETLPQINWLVQPALNENTFYEWRARASDGVAVSAWTNTRTFYVNAVNEPPAAPAEILTLPGAELRPEGILAWSGSSDPDAFDIISYVLEIDDDPDFSSVLISQADIQATSISLDSLAEYEKLADDTWYYWRVKAVDDRGGESPWISGDFYFNRVEIEIYTAPDGAQVFIDGNPAYPGWRASPESTPLIVQDVSETLHTVNVVKEGYELFTAIADNRAGADAVIDAILSPAVPVALDKPVIVPPHTLVPGGQLFRSRPFLADWNMDGTPDMLLSDGSGLVHLTLGADMPSYEGVLLDVGSLFGTPVYNAIVFAVDWDNDADYDLLVGNTEGDVLLAINAGTQESPSFVAGGKIQVLSQDLMVTADSAPAVVDWNGDGKKDLIVGCSTGTVTLYVNSGSDESPEFDSEVVVESQAGPLIVPGGQAVPFGADWNNDGLTDLLIGSGDHKMYVYLNIGTPGNPILQGAGSAEYYVNKNKQEDADLGPYPTPYLADWDGDGLRDLASGNGNGEFVMFPGIMPE